MKNIAQIKRPYLAPAIYEIIDCGEEVLAANTVDAPDTEGGGDWEGVDESKGITPGHFNLWGDEENEENW